MSRLFILKRNVWDGTRLYEKSFGTPPMPVVVPDDFKPPKDAVEVFLKKGKTIEQALAEQAKAQEEGINKANKEMLERQGNKIRDIGQLELIDEPNLSPDDVIRKQNAADFRRQLANEQKDK